MPAKNKRHKLYFLPRTVRVALSSSKLPAEGKLHLPQDDNRMLIKHTSFAVQPLLYFKNTLSSYKTSATTIAETSCRRNLPSSKCLRPCFPGAFRQFFRSLALYFGFSLLPEDTKYNKQV